MRDQNLNFHVNNVQSNLGKKITLFLIVKYFHDNNVKSNLGKKIILFVIMKYYTI